MDSVTYMMVPGAESPLPHLRAVQAAARLADVALETIAVLTRWSITTEDAVEFDQVLYCEDTPHIGPAHDMALSAAIGDYYVYLCNRHITIRNDLWLKELLAPLRDGADAAGMVLPHGFGPTALGLARDFDDADRCYRVHLQGGLWAGRTSVLRQYPHHPKYPHGYEDVYRSWCLQRADRSIASVPTIYSTGVRTQVCPDDADYSIIHDYRGTLP